MSVLLDWNGADLPDELRRLPAGRYVIASIEEATELSEEEEDGVLRALESVRAGEKLDMVEVRARVRSAVQR